MQKLNRVNKFFTFFFFNTRFGNAESDEKFQKNCFFYKKFKIKTNFEKKNMILKKNKNL